MAKKTKKVGNFKEVEFGDPAVVEAMENKQPLPSGIRIKSPYGSTNIDVGTMELVGDGPGGDDTGGGAATGGDGNTGSSAASTPSGGARD